MRGWVGIMVLACLSLSACQSRSQARSTILVDGLAVEVAGTGRIPAAIIRGSGTQLGSSDRVINNGLDVDPEEALALDEPMHLQVFRSVPILINGSPLLTTALTVGEAVQEQGFTLYSADLLDPPGDSPITSGLVISYTPATLLQASADGQMLTIRSAATSGGSALADAGLPMQGLDFVQPSEPQTPAADQALRLTRVVDALLLAQELIPFDSLTTESAELELDVEQVLQPGTPGLAVTSTRVRRQDGAEVSRESATKSVVLEPQARKVIRGTKLVEKTEMIDGVSITYWRSMQMYATIYSPCNSGTADGSCSAGTASGRPAGKGVVAVDPGVYAYLNGQRLYIPGYGFAVIGDIGGGYIIEQKLGISRYKWIDLGFDDSNIQDMTGWVSVYFLTPAPPSIPDVLR